MAMMVAIALVDEEERCKGNSLAYWGFKSVVFFMAIQVMSTWFNTWYMVSELPCHFLHMHFFAAALLNPVVFFMAYGLLLVVLAASGWCYI